MLKMKDTKQSAVKISPPGYSPKVFTFGNKQDGRYIVGLTSSGEIIRNDDVLSVLDCVDMNRLRKQKQKALTEFDVIRASNEIAAAQFSAFELGVIRAVEYLQVDNSAFARVWGGAINGRLMINLSVEFVLFDDDAEGWRRVRSWIKEQGGIENVMDRRARPDKSRPDGAKRWKIGANHNRPETQIDVIWRVEQMTLQQLRAKIQKLRETSNGIWQSYGMGVF